MHGRKQISLFKLLLRVPYQRSPKPTIPFFLESLPITIPLVPDSLASSSPKLFYSSPSILHAFAYPYPKNPQNEFSSYHIRRGHSTESGGDAVRELDVNKEVDLVNLKFAEAREEIEMAMESKETVYFDEEAQCARVAVKEVVDMFEGLLAKLPEREKASLQRSMGLKIEQLKAELKQLDE